MKDLAIAYLEKLKVAKEKNDECEIEDVLMGVYSHDLVLLECIMDLAITATIPSNSIEITASQRESLLKLFRFVLPIMGAHSGNEEMLADIETIKEKLGKK